MDFEVVFMKFWWVVVFWGFESCMVICVCVVLFLWVFWVLFDYGVLVIVWLSFVSVSEIFCFVCVVLLCIWERFCNFCFSFFVLKWSIVGVRFECDVSCLVWVMRVFLVVGVVEFVVFLVFVFIIVVNMIVYRVIGRILLNLSVFFIILLFF